MTQSACLLLALAMAALASDPACITVERPQVLVKDLAVQHAELRAIPQSTIVTAAPAFGVVRQLSIPWLTQWSQSQGLAVVWKQPVCVLRRAARAEDIAWEAEVREALTSLFDYRPGPGELQILERALMAGEPGKVSLEKTGLSYETARNSYLWRGKLVGEHSSSALNVRFEIRRTVSRWITAKPLAAGKPLREDEFVREERPFRLESTAARPFDVLPEHAVLRRSLPKGAELLPQHLMDAPLIFSGDNVELESRAGQAVIRMPGVARTKARKGDPVLVYLPEGNRMLRAIAVAPGRVEIQSATTARKP